MPKMFGSFHLPKLFDGAPGKADSSLPDQPARPTETASAKRGSPGPTRNQGATSGSLWRMGARQISLLGGYSRARIAPSSVAQQRMPDAAEVRLPGKKMAKAQVGKVQSRYHALTAQAFARPGRKAAPSAPGSAAAVGTQPAYGSAEPMAKRAAHDRNSFTAAVEQLFTPAHGEMPGPEARLLAQQLARTALQHRLADTAPYSASLQIARALHFVSDGDAGLAMAVLHHMRGPCSLIDMGGPQAERQLAWQAARILSQSPMGIEALLALHDDPSLQGMALAPRMKREALIMFLQSSHEILAKPDSQADRSSASRLHSYAQQCSASPEVAQHELLALHALQAALAVFYAPEHIPADDVQVGAYFAWRNTLHQQGAGTTLERIQKGLLRLPDKWISRAETRASYPLVAFDPRRALGMRKTPLAAMAYGASGVNLGLLGEEAEKLHHSVLACIARLAARCAAMPEPRPEYVTQLSAVLRYWTQTLRVPDHVKTRHVATRLQKAQPSPASSSAYEVTEHRLRSIKFKPFKHFSLDALEKWNAALDVLAVPPAGSDSDFSSLLMTARELENASPIKPSGGGREQVKQALLQIVQSPPGNNVRYYDGGSHGVNLHASVNLAGLSVGDTHLGASITPLGKFVLGRHAFLEVGSSSYGGELFFGIDQRRSLAVGASAFAGVKFDLGVLQNKMGVGLGATYNREQSAPSGVIIRSRMMRNEEQSINDNWRKPLARVIDFMFAASSIKQTHPQSFWNTFSRWFFHQPDIGINWRDNDRLSHAVSLSGFVGVRMALKSGTENSYIGAAAQADYNWLPYSRNHRIDANGSLAGTELSMGRWSAGSLNVSFTISAPAFGAPDSHATGSPSSATLPAMPLLGCTIPFRSKGSFAIVRLVDEDGHLNPKFSRLLIEFPDPHNFIAYVEQLRAAICPTEHSQNTLDEFLASVKSAARRGNQYYGESRKLTRQVAEKIVAYKSDIDTLQALQKSAGKTSHQDEIDRLNCEIFLLLNDQNNSECSAFYVYEMITNGYAERGIPLGLQFTSGTASLGERQLLQLTMADLSNAANPDETR